MGPGMFEGVGVLIQAAIWGAVVFPFSLIALALAIAGASGWWAGGVEVAGVILGVVAAKMLLRD